MRQVASGCALGPWIGPIGRLFLAIVLIDCALLAAEMPGQRDPLLAHTCMRHLISWHREMTGSWLLANQDWAVMR
jgi:hypothetical protein